MVKRSVAERRRYLEMYRVSGESIVGFCRTQGLNAKTFGNWLREDRLGMSLHEYRKLHNPQSRAKSNNKLQRKSSTSSSAPIIAPVSIVPPITSSSDDLVIPRLALHLPSGIKVELFNLDTRQIGDLIKELLPTNNNESTSTFTSRCSH